MICDGTCEHVRSFRYGWDGSKILAPYNGRDKVAGCELRPELTLHMRACPVCWKHREE